MRWSEFFTMGGYGFFVWGSYIIALLLIGGEVALVIRRKKSLRQQVNPDQLPVEDNHETTS
jgi:heme exporter protein D